MKKIINYIKSWNWTLLVVCICMSTLGAASNKHIDSVLVALVFGFIAGIVFGLPMAIASRDEN